MIRELFGKLNRRGEKIRALFNRRAWERSKKVLSSEKRQGSSELKDKDKDKDAAALTQNSALRTQKWWDVQPQRKVKPRRYGLSKRERLKRRRVYRLSKGWRV